MTDGQLLKNWQTLICASLVLHRAADGNIVIAAAPVFWKAVKDAFRTLGDHIERKVAALTNHRPGFRTPRIGILYEEIRSEAGPHQRTRRDLVSAASIPLNRHPEHGGFVDQVAVDAVG